MSDLVSRLLAAIEEAEQKALAVPEHLRADRWTHPGPWVMHGGESRSEDEVALVGMTGRQAEAIAEHIALNDPAAVLRRCAADKAAVLWFKAGMDRLERLNHVAERRPLTAAESADRAVTVVVVSEGHDYMTFMASAYGISVEEETAGAT